MDLPKRNKPNGDASALRQELVDTLKSQGTIQSPSVEAAFRAVSRHLFVPDAPLDQVYSDRSVVIKKDQDGQWLSSSSQPAIMAIMLEQLGLQLGHKVLEIGAGSGYNAALMAHIVGESGQVVTVEIDADLTQAARENLTSAGYERVRAVCADGGYGYPDAAPYDRIILTVGAPDVVPAWVEQLKPGGRLVLPLLIAGQQYSIAFEKTVDCLTTLSITGCGFIPLRGAFAEWPIRPIQLGPDPDLQAFVGKEQATNAEAIYKWLTGPGKDKGTGIKVTSGQVRSGLDLWLGLHESGKCGLMAKGDMADRDIVPPLGRLGGEWKSTFTTALVGDAGLAALTRSPDQPAPVMDINALHTDESPFELFIRRFGSDESVARRLLGQIKAWDAAGRPSSKDLRVRVYQRDSDYTPVEDEIVIEKKWTRLVLDWSAHS